MKATRRSMTALSVVWGVCLGLLVPGLQAQPRAEDGRLSDDRAEWRERPERPERRAWGDRDDDRIPERGRDRDRPGPSGPEALLLPRLAELHEEARHVVMQFIHEHCRGLWRELEEVMRTRPGSAEAHRLADEAVEQATELLELRERNPELFEQRLRLGQLERHADELAEQARRAGPDRAKQLERELQQVLGEAFGLKQAQLKAEIAALEEELGHLRQALQKREAGREAIISRHARELMGVEDELAW